MTNIIVSYDGTDNDQDALALGEIFAGAGASLILAYVRHSRGTGEAERLAEKDAEALLAEGAASVGKPDMPKHVVLSASTPLGLRELAASENAEMIVFGSAYRTTPGYVYPQTSAERLLDGGRTAIALAPAGYRDATSPIKTIASIAEEGDASAIDTSEGLASRFSAEYIGKPNGGGADLLVVGSAPQTATGQVRVSAAAAYMIELIRCPVLVLPRGVALTL
jgi:nucleotide-binding universal stress UspA family protein